MLDIVSQEAPAWEPGAFLWPGVFSPLPAGSTNAGYLPAPLAEGGPLAGLRDAASRAWVRKIVEVVNNSLRGKLNVTLAVTLTAGADATTVIDARISITSALLLMPLTASAAAEQAAGTLYVSAQQSGQATIAHANTATSDRSFRLVILA